MLLRTSKAATFFSSSSPSSSLAFNLFSLVSQIKEAVLSTALGCLEKFSQAMSLRNISLA